MSSMNFQKVTDRAHDYLSKFWMDALRVDACHGVVLPALSVVIALLILMCFVVIQLGYGHVRTLELQAAAILASQNGANNGFYEDHARRNAEVALDLYFRRSDGVTSGANYQYPGMPNQSINYQNDASGIRISVTTADAEGLLAGFMGELSSLAPGARASATLSPLHIVYLYDLSRSLLGDGSVKKLLALAALNAGVGSLTDQHVNMYSPYWAADSPAPIAARKQLPFYMSTHDPLKGLDLVDSINSSPELQLQVFQIIQSEFQSVNNAGCTPSPAPPDTCFDQQYPNCVYDPQGIVPGDPITYPYEILNSPLAYCSTRASDDLNNVHLSAFQPPPPPDTCFLVGSTWLGDSEPSIGTFGDVFLDCPFLYTYLGEAPSGEQGGVPGNPGQLYPMQWHWSDVFRLAKNLMTLLPVALDEVGTAHSMALYAAASGAGNPALPDGNTPDTGTGQQVPGVFELIRSTPSVVQGGRGISALDFAKLLFPLSSETPIPVPLGMDALSFNLALLGPDIPTTNPLSQALGLHLLDDVKTLDTGYRTSLKEQITGIAGQIFPEGCLIFNPPASLPIPVFGPGPDPTPDPTGTVSGAPPLWENKLGVITKDQTNVENHLLCLLMSLWVISGGTDTAGAYEYAVQRAQEASALGQRVVVINLTDGAPSGNDVFQPGADIGSFISPDFTAGQEVAAEGKSFSKAGNMDYASQESRIIAAQAQLEDLGSFIFTLYFDTSFGAVVPNKDDFINLSDDPTKGRYAIEVQLASPLAGVNFTNERENEERINDALEALVMLVRSVPQVSLIGQ